MDEKKVREAIKYFKIMLFDMEGMGFKYIPEYYETAIEALEKQLPQKVEVKEWSPARCPSCGTELSESLGDGYYMHPTFLKRCPNVDCSQLLDWSE
ncbi:hypothetical protein [Mediterraneibacter gnavus]|uniref:hypothetical protein n=1 Tax=Mediterraneibacter gnavus TaxID=33038 RepID=UPI0004636F3F|nr:hypothetical protein [Mediterraneibacter gnavus]